MPIPSSRFFCYYQVFLSSHRQNLMHFPPSIPLLLQLIQPYSMDPCVKRYFIKNIVPKAVWYFVKLTIIVFWFLNNMIFMHCMICRLLFSSVQFSHLVMSNSLQTYGLQHARFPCPSPTTRVYSNSSPLSWWCHPTISSSVIPVSSCLQSFPASGSVQMSQLFASGGQSIGVSASASVLPVNIQAWFPLGWSGWISLQSKGLSRVFSNTTVQKHQFFGVQLSL